MKAKNKRLLVFLTSNMLIFIAGALASFNWFIMGNILWVEAVELAIFVAGLFMSLYHCDLWRQYEKDKFVKKGVDEQ